MDIQDLNKISCKDGKFIQSEEISRERLVALKTRLEERIVEFQTQLLRVKGEINAEIKEFENQVAKINIILG